MSGWRASRAVPAPPKAPPNPASDYADEPVPEAARFPAARVGVTTGAWIIAMSTFFTGGVLASGLDFEDAVLAAGTGQAILAGIGFLTALAGAQRRLSTAMLTRQVYGSAGGRALGLAIAFVLGVGWFAWQLSFFGQTIETSFGGTPLTDRLAAMVWGAAVTTITVLFGFRLLSLVSALAVPAIVLLSFYGLFLAIDAAGGFPQLFAAEAGGPALPMITAISLVVGNGIVGNVMFPDLSRFARGPAAGASAAAIGYGLAGFVILLCGAAIVYAANAPPGDLPGAMKAVGVGVPAFVILIIAQWATNKGNLYSGVLCFVAATRLNQRLVTVAMGLVGLAMAVAGIQEHFVPLLTFLGNFMPPIAAGLIVHVLLLKRRQPCAGALWALLGGGAAGYAAERLLPSVPPALVAFAVGGGLHWAIAVLAMRRATPLAAADP